MKYQGSALLPRATSSFAVVATSIMAVLTILAAFVSMVRGTLTADQAVAYTVLAIGTLALSVTASLIADLLARRPSSRNNPNHKEQ